jgi:hypothetical protein
MSRGRYIFLNKNKLDNFNISLDSFVPTPSKDDYLRGYIVRFFVQKANDKKSHIFEISHESFKEYSNNPLLSTTKLDWRLTGEDGQIKNSNRESIRISSKSIPNLYLYLPNLLQFKQK